MTTGNFNNNKIKEKKKKVNSYINKTLFFSLNIFIYLSMILLLNIIYIYICIYVIL